MINNICLIITTNNVSIQTKTGYINLLLDINDGMATLPTINLKSINYFIDNMLDTLTPREEKVIRIIYNLDLVDSISINELAKSFNCKIEDILSIRDKALRKLKHPSRKETIQKRVYVVQNSIYEGDYKYCNYKSIIKQLFEEDMKNHEMNDDAYTVYYNSIMEQKKCIDSTKTNSEILLDSIEKLDLSARGYNVLKRAGFDNINKVLQLDVNDLLHLRNSGKRVVCEILNNIYAYLEEHAIYIDEKYPLFEGINKLDDDLKSQIVLEHSTFSHEVNENEDNLSIESLFDANFSPRLINTLLSYGFYNFYQIVRNEKEIKNILKKSSKLLLKEFTNTISKYTDISCIIELDSDLLNFISEKDIENYCQLKHNYHSIESSNNKNIIERVMNYIDSYNYLEVSSYMFDIENKKEPDDDFDDIALDIESAFLD